MRREDSFHLLRAASAGLRRKVACALALGATLLSIAIGPAARALDIPLFWDPRARPDRPDVSSLRNIRFLTDDEYPPLHFAGPDGAPTGFSVELARAVCERLAITCTVQVRRFDTLLDSLSERRGDVVAAAVPVTTELRRRFATTVPYWRLPARFVARREPQPPIPTPQSLDARGVAVIAGTAHEAFLAAFFPKARLQPLPSLAAAEAALRRGEVDFIFADGIGLALWLGGTDAAGCCIFAGGPYLESRFFGEGVAFITRKDDETLRRALDFALYQLADEGRFAEIYLRFFPVSPF